MGDHHQQQQQQPQFSSSKELMDSFWTTCGIGEYINLPVIVLLGDTSSGKSSVLSNLVGIDLPSGSSLTTKTPILIQVVKKKKNRHNQSNDSGNDLKSRGIISTNGTATNAVIDIQWRTTDKGTATATATATTSTSTAVASPRQRPISPSRERKREIEQQHSSSSAGLLQGSSELENNDEPSSSSDNNGNDDNIDTVFVDETKTDDVRQLNTGHLTPNQSQFSPPFSSFSVDEPPVWKPHSITELSDIPSVIQKAQELILSFRKTQIAPDVILLTIYHYYYYSNSSSSSSSSSMGQRSSNHREEEEEEEEEERGGLTLVDLPGLVQYQHTSDASLLSQVEQVVLEYVQNPRSILVPVVAAPTNIHNSKVLQWCRTYDPTTKRTIPVLTKPDLIDKGSENDVLQLLLNMKEGEGHNMRNHDEQQKTKEDHRNQRTSPDTFQFRHGYFMVKNRGQAALESGSTIEDGLQEEKEYFETTHPWNDRSVLDDAIIAQRFGIPALQTTLSTSLRQLFDDSLPEIVREIEEQCKTAEETLEAWGEVHETKSEQRRFYQQLVSKIVSTMEYSLSGKGAKVRSRRGGSTSSATRNRIFSDVSGDIDLSNEKTMGGAARLHAACSAFMKEIQKGSLATVSTLVEGCPVIVSGTTDDIKGELVHLDEENGFCCVDFVDEKDHTTAELFDGIDYKAGDHPMETDEVWSDGTRIFISRGQRFDSLRQIPLKKVRTDPSWLEKSIAKTRTESSIVFINSDMFHSIVAEFVEEDWAPACHDLVQSLESILMDSLEMALHESFGAGSRYPLLFEMVKDHSKQTLSKLVANARLEVESHLDVESHPYTQDKTLLEKLKNMKLAQIKKDLEVQLRLDQEGVVFDSGALSTIVDRVFARASRRNFLAEEMEMVLSCYGKVATQRVVDRTPQICWSVSRRAASSIESELAYVTDDVLETLLWESPEQKAQYQRLQQKADNLRSALRTVKSMK